MDKEPEIVKFKNGKYGVRRYNTVKRFFFRKEKSIEYLLIWPNGVERPQWCSADIYLRGTPPGYSLEDCKRGIGWLTDWTAPEIDYGTPVTEEKG